MQESTITTKGQTTLPRDVRQALGLQPGDKVRYTIHEDGQVILRKKRSVMELSGILKRAGAVPITLAEMDEAIAEGATSGT